MSGRVPYIVFTHYTELKEIKINAYSPAQAKYLIEKRMSNKGLFKAEVDDVISETDYKNKYKNTGEDTE